MSLSFCDLPNEVIYQILHFATPRSLAAFQRVSRRCNNLADPALWRYHCMAKFKYWSPEHRIKEISRGAIDEVDWKVIYVQRHEVDRATSHAIDSILSSQASRIDKIQRIVDFGYDAKDSLLRHYHVQSDAEDALARRFYSDAVLGCLHRTMAIDEWSRLQESDEISLERALSAFDMFVLGSGEGDFDKISARLDEIAGYIRKEHTGLEDESTRRKAHIICAHLRANNLTGLRSPHEKYHELRNNFLGLALQAKGHPSMPLVSTAIYCSIAQRLGVDARPCGFPFHVIPIIRPPMGHDLDGGSVQGNTAAPMYMDPFCSDEEVLQVELIDRLRSVGATQETFPVFLNASSTTEIVLRTGRNILNSVQASQHSGEGDVSGPNENESSRYPNPDPESSFYSALWSSILFGISQDGDDTVIASVRRHHLLPHIVEHFETHFPVDIALIEKHIVPLFQSDINSAQLRESVRVVRVVDAMPKLLKRRTMETSTQVRYRVGEIFRHRRYDYKAVVIGWDVECGASEQWMAQMRIHELARGRHQSFYHVLVEDESMRYVAEENLDTRTPILPDTLMHLAGRYFKRWDSNAHRFISNIQDEYPDD